MVVVWRPLPSTLAGRLDRHHLLAEQRVGERGLARAGLSEQHTGTARDERAENVDALARRRADRQHPYARARWSPRPGRGRRAPTGSGTRSALVRTTSGCAPDSQARARNRSMRPRSSSTASDTAMIAWSTLAARICPSDRLEEVLRTNAVRRGRYARTNRGSPTGFDGGPVAGADDPHRVVRGDERGVGAQRAVGGHHVALAAVDPDDPAGHQALFGVRGELRRPAVVPAVRGERRARRSVER